MAIQYFLGYYFMEVRYYGRVECVPIHARFIDTSKKFVPIINFNK